VVAAPAPIGWSGTSAPWRDDGPRYVDDLSLGSLPGSRIALRLVRSASEDEVIAAFLRAEIDSDRFGQGILVALEADHRRRAIVDSANMRGPQENRYRRSLLGRVRGWGRGEGMFQGSRQRWSGTSLRLRPRSSPRSAT
jgi:hypothetical protein